MLKRSKRIFAASLAMTMLLAQTAYAETVYTAQYPGAAGTGTNGGPGTYISQTGPTGGKQVGENGYVVAGTGTSWEQGYVNAGPGAGGIEGTGVTNNNGGIIVSGNGGNTTAQNPSGNVSNPSGTAQSPSGTTNTGTVQSPSGTTQTTNNQITIDQSIAKPTIYSEGAILYDATTNQILYGKNETKAMHPASMTKLMTALLVAENLSLDDTVTYSATATQNLESGAATVQLTTGDTLTVRDSMYALMLKSACEVANGLAEKVAGTQAAFAQRMNERAKQLGCQNTNFTNASGLNDANHYTTAYDMALITKAALDNATVKAIDQTLTYTLPASKNRGALKITNGHKMLNPSDSRYYQGIIGGKTGYTSKAGNTLATAAMVGGHELIAVVMKSTQKQYDDTKALFDYGAKLISASGNAGTSSGTETANAGWIQVSDTQWQYRKANGQLCKSEWLDVNGGTYWFDDTTYMATGWRHFSNGAWYYFNPQNGAMVKEKWVTDNGKSYYLQSDGTMAVNTVINDTYQVDANGVYVKKLK